VATAISGFTAFTIFMASSGVMCPIHGLPRGLITEMMSALAPMYSSSIPSKYSVSAVYPMVPTSGIFILKPTASGSVCLAFVVATFVSPILKLTPGFTVIVFSVIFWWYVEITGPASVFPSRTLGGAASSPRFFSMPRVMASTRISASL